jgi:hypothetical protein
MDINPYQPSATPNIPAKPTSASGSRFGRARLYVFLVIWLGFTIWTYLIVSSGLSAPTRSRVALTTASTILGPMTGAISRDMQGCCLRFSLSLLPYCAASVGIAAVAQMVRLPFERFAGAVRMLLWILGWTGWFMGGIVSFIHALF